MHLDLRLAVVAGSKQPTTQLALPGVRRMNPWLITWETHTNRVRNPVAAILHNTTSEESVCDMMRLLYANFLAAAGDRLSPSEQVRFAKRQYLCKPRRAQFGRLFSDDKPVLFARHVFAMRQSKDKEGYEMLTWEEGIYPQIAQDTRPEEIAKHFNRKMRRPRKRRQMTFYARTMAIVMGAEINDAE